MLLLGPLYHLYNKADKQKAIQEALRVTKQGGIIFVAYEISDVCLLDEGFNRGNISVSEYIKNGLLDAETLRRSLSQKIYLNLFGKKI